MKKPAARYPVLFAVMMICFLCLVPVFAGAEEPGGFYVSALGNDGNDGLSEQSPFRTLKKAVNSALEAKVYRVTVTGTLSAASEYPGEKLFKIPGEQDEATGKEDSVFSIDLEYFAGLGELLITGRPGGDACLQGRRGRRVIKLTGEGDFCVRFEHITITGGSAEGSEESGFIRGWGGGIFASGMSITAGEGFVLSGNRASQGAGGLYIQHGSFTMEKNAVIRENSASTDEAGGAVIMNAVFVMKDDSAITGNTSGGIIIAGSKGTLRGNASISDNVCEFDGAAVMAVQSRLIIEENARISGNRAGRDGGAVFAADASVLLAGNARIAGNEAGRDGGAVNGSGTRASLMVRGNGEISGNAAGDDGGGIHFEGGRVILSGDARLLDNSAGCGGGLCVELGSKALVRDRALVGGNRSSGGDQGGGGLCGGIESVIRMTGGEVRDNESPRGGGVYIEGGSFFHMGGLITNNRSESDGGVYFTGPGDLYISEEQPPEGNIPDNVRR